MMNKIIEEAAKKYTNYSPDDVVGEDGLRRCRVCGVKKETKLEFPLRSGKYRVFPCVCECEKQKEAQRRKHLERERFEDYVRSLYSFGITDRMYREHTLETDDNRNPALSKFCREYIGKWDKVREHCYGALFYGDTGGGKSFYACCIANALIKQGVRVLVSRLSDLVRNYTDSGSPTVNLGSFDLIVLDDIGVENASATAYNILDNIYRRGTVLICTTNLSSDDMKYPRTIEEKRIYDRVLERCPAKKLVEVKKTRLDMAKQAGL